MQTDSPTQNRLTELEIKASFMEDQIDQLDQVIVRQQQQLDLLLREVANLKMNKPDATQTAPRNLRDELPPHY